MVALAKSRKNTMLERQTGNSWGSLDRPLGFKAGDTNLQRYVGNSPPNKVDPSGLADLSNGSNIVVENSTGLFGEWLESAVDGDRTCGSTD
jgi:hypothetical protein